MTPPAARLAAPPWRWRHLSAAPHRLAFFMAMLVLLASAAWWAGVQAQRAGLAGLSSPVLPAGLAHAAVMVLGFIPLFFTGFLFTAGPRWLGTAAPGTHVLLPALAAQTGGWLLWLAGSHVHSMVAALGLALALGGLARVAMRFWRMTARSTAADRSHALVISGALALGSACLAGITGAVAAGAFGLARSFVLCALWGFVVAVYLAVAHRMIPFFTSGAMPVGRSWHPSWMLWTAVAGAAFEAAAVWLDPLWHEAAAWQWLRGSAELLAAAGVAALAVSWSRAQNLRIRLLAMLHLGFLWLGLALAIAGVSRLLGPASPAPGLPLAALHALTMGCLGSLMLAMVTRVSCGHGGRPVVADDFVWSLFWLLQAATLLRVFAAVPAMPVRELLALASLLWAIVMVAWGIRQGAWYGRARSDGRPG